MSFLSAVGGFLKNVAHGAEKVTDVLQPFAPLISSIPGIGGPFGAILTLVIQAEHLSSAKGADKKVAVMAFMKLAYPSLDTTIISTEIDNLVAILNRLAAAAPVPATAPTS